MYTSTEAKGSLKTETWEEGRTFPLVWGPYRYRVVVCCTREGRQVAEFANGANRYFCYVEIISGSGQWVRQGVSTVPVLPDGRLIMVVEQRPVHTRYYDGPLVALIGGQSVDLRQYGLHSSLEFPGGGVQPGEAVRAGFLRELGEETGVEAQTALCYRRAQSIYLFGSDLAVEQFFDVVFLTGFSFEERVESDGGLTVFALTREEVQWNVWNGVIRSGQAALMHWAFYQEVEIIRQDPELERSLIECGYLSVEQVVIPKIS